MSKIVWQGISLLLILCAPMLGSAQEKCATDHFHEEQMLHNETYRSYFENKDRTVLTNGPTRSNNTLTVPVIVHVFHDDGPENISRAQILDALEVMNADIQRNNADASDTRPEFQSVATGANIEFKLATIGPGGECTDGIIRYRTPLTKSARNDIKNLTVSDNIHYLNIYVVASIWNFTGGNGTILGYAYYPNPGQSFLNDGIVMRHDVMGRIGTATTGFGPTNQGRTLTHEAGHYLGLPHTFDGNSCSGFNDGFSDTPAISSSNSGCNWGDSCPGQPGNDQGENYMDYSNGICQNMFSAQQVAAMEGALLGTRNALVTSTNLANTGVSTPGPTCAPNADFILASPYQCGSSGSINATDISWNGPVTSRQWEVLGTFLPTMTDSVVSISGMPPGLNILQLTTSNAQGSSSAIRYINVLADTGITPQFYSESFEPPFALNADYQVQPRQVQNTWALNSLVGAPGGAQCVYLDNYSKIFGAQESLLLPPLDMTQQASSVLTFKYAFAERDTSNSDELRVYVSTNCGTTWIPRKIIKGQDLVTAPQQANSEFTPGPNQWRTSELNLAAYQTFDYVLVRFEFTSGGGNNFFLDDINIFEPLGSEENAADDLKVYPVPFQNKFVIEWPSVNSDKVLIEVYDMTDRLVHIDNQEALSGRWEMDGTQWAKGAYLVKVTSKKDTLFKRVIKVDQ